MTRSIPTALTGQRLAVVDIEGNGGQPPEIVEIAVLTLDQPISREDVATWLVRPSQPIAPLVTRKVHGISDADVAHCPVWADISDKVADRLTDRILVAHNASVEHRGLTAHLPAWRPPMVLDTLRLAKHVWPGLTVGYGLDKLIVHADLETSFAPEEIGRRHRADYDTWMTTGLFLALVEQSGLDWLGLVRAAALSGFDQTSQPQEGLW